VNWQQNSNGLHWQPRACRNLVSSGRFNFFAPPPPP
jgi:hypothetical protein